jgi:hypothetical protein
MKTGRLRRLSARERKTQRARLASKKRYAPADYERLLTPILDCRVTVTLAEFAASHDTVREEVVLVRHDIDHDYETALALAAWEHDRGIRATYCVLHTAWYYGELRNGRYEHTDELVRLCRQLHEWGHEVNLHNNAVVVALEKGCDPVRLLQEELDFIRGEGVPVVGTAMHGDALCRKLGFRNCEIFREAVREEFGGPRTVSHGGASVELGAVGYADLGLTYEAYDMAWGRYVTDSGGALRSRLDVPGLARIAHPDGPQCVTGVLTHPVWWRFPDS